MAIRPTAPKVDGKLDDWTQASWALIESRTGQVGDWGRVGLTTRAAAAVAGDLRLLISRVKAKPVAVLYRPVAPGAKGQPVLFSSPLRTLRFDRVDDVTDQVTLADTTVKNKRGNRDLGIFEASVPLSLLGLTPKPGQTLRADVGVLRGNGFRTLRRVYWCNKATGLTSDEPSEAELTPQLWGRWEFVEQGQADRP